jgi:hypothetical protein
VVNLEILGGSNRWNVSFARAAHDWEVNVFASFFQVLHSVRVRKGCEEQLWWTPAKRGLFEVKSFFSSLASPKSKLRLLQGRSFLHGLRLKARSSPWIISGSGTSS